MWAQQQRNVLERKVNGLIAVAIDKDKGSQSALKWAIDHILQKGCTVILVHVKLRSNATPSKGDNSLICNNPDPQTRDLFLPFRCFCSRKDIQCKDIVLEESDVPRALIEFVSQNAIETLVIGAAAKAGFLRFKTTDIPGTLSKGAPDFCSVFVISKGKIQSMRTALRPAPAFSPLRSQILSQPTVKPTPAPAPVQAIEPPRNSRAQKPPLEPSRTSTDDADFFKSPFTRRGLNGKSYGEISMPDTDISFVSSGRPSIDQIFPAFYENSDPGRTPPRLSNFSDFDDNQSYDSMPFGRRSVDISCSPEFSSASMESERMSNGGSQGMDDVEAEMRRLKLELKQTMEMYSTACKEALTAKQKAGELQRWKKQEERRLEEARQAEEAALAIAEREKAKSRAAIEAAESAQRIAQLEAQKRINAEMKASQEAEEKKKEASSFQNDVRYRRYSIEEIEEATQYFSESLKIGEGGYGPVYKCYLDHTPVAVKVLRPDAAQGRMQFNQEVEVLSCIRHPNMVLLLGACPEYGCLVYEHMAMGSLEDCLSKRRNIPPLSWQLRFRIAAEIGTGLLFLHQSKPEPLVHRDLKPANILLDRNFVSKISDVGLARLVPPSVAETVTQYRMTQTAGTFCYIDPEYQQTGMLGVKSDIYSLGIIFLQILTAKPPMGLTHYVERAIEKGTFTQMLDPAVTDWPVEEALSFAKMSLKCSELRRKDRPDLGKVILPELNKLRSLAEETMPSTWSVGGSTFSSPNNSRASIHAGSSCPNMNPSDG